MSAPDVYFVKIFAADPEGGNPAPIIFDASKMSDQDMQDVARMYGHESAFVLPANPLSGCDFEYRFWVPNHEMEMCGHACCGATWLLAEKGRLPRDDGVVMIQTKSGRVHAIVTRPGRNGYTVEISQPRGVLESFSSKSERSRKELLQVLGIISDDILPGIPIQNAATSRVKTLIPLRSVSILDALNPDFARMAQLCEDIGSTGLYPYAVVDSDACIFAARQFPKSSGYPEDPATGIAAAALAFGLLNNGLLGSRERVGDVKVRIRQGWAMGKASEIEVRFETSEDGEVERCWIGGRVEICVLDPVTQGKD